MEQKLLFRRIIMLSLVTMMLLSLAACGKDPSETVDPITAEQAITQLKEQAESLGFDNALSELEEKSTTQIGSDSYIRLQQQYNGIPVYGKTVVCVANEKGELTSVSGNVVDINPDINLDPTVTMDIVESKIRTYASDTLGREDDLSAAIEITLDQQYIFDGSTLANMYYVMFGGNILDSHKVLVDAHSAQVLNWESVFSDFVTNSEMLENANISCDENTDHELFLFDQQRNITIFAVDQETVDRLQTIEDIVADTSLIVTVDPDGEASEGVDALVHTAQIHDFYAVVLNRQGYDGKNAPVYVYLCAEDMLTDNAKGNASPDYGTLFIGTARDIFTEPISKALDILAHEYTHMVFKMEAGDTQDIHSDSVNEAIADIFGNVIELYVNGEQDASWPLAEDAGYIKYNMADSVTMASYGESAHDNARILSHSAYLMWNGIDGSNSKRLSTAELAELWYRAVLMMPSDCDFILCRQLVEVAAQSMETLDDEQRACVREAFNRVEIPSTREDTFYADYRLNEDATLTVYDQNNESYSGYTLRINGTIDMSEIASNMTPDIGWVVNRTNTVEEVGAYALDLPQGCYSLTISDPHYDESYTIYVEISDEYTETNIDLITAYEEPLIVIIPQRKQLTRIDKYDQSGSVVNHKIFSYNDFGFLEEEVSRDIDQGECVFELQTRFTYDGNNRLISRITENPEYPGESSGVKYTYDNLGRITGSMAWEGGAVELQYEYDSQNRVIRTTEMYDAGSSVTEHTYDDCGRLIKDVRVSCEEWSNDTWTDTTVYSYDAEGRLSSTVMEGAYQTVTQVYDYSYLPFVIVDYCYNGGSHYFYAMLPDGSLDMMTTMVFEDPQFYTDEEGYLAKVIDNDDYWGTCVYEFYYDDEIAIPENGPFRVQTGEASESHTYDEAEALLYEHLVQIYGSDGLDITQVNSAVYNGITLQMTISGESGAPIYVIEWYTVDLETGVVTKSETGSYVCDLW